MENPTETKIITFHGKWTEKGAYLQHHLFTESGIKISSQMINESGTGHNWDDAFMVNKNETYILIVVYITNTGRHQCRIDNLKWNGEKTSITPLVHNTINIKAKFLCSKCFGGMN